MCVEIKNLISKNFINNEFHNLVITLIYLLYTVLSNDYNSSSILL